MLKFIKKIQPKHLLYSALFFECINLIYFIRVLKKKHYLPTPFVMDKNDTFMDFYNPLFWIIKDGFYTAFNSVYPALNYFILKFFVGGVVSTEVANAFQLRNENSELTLFVLSIYIGIIYWVLNLGEWKKFSLATRALIFLACTFSIPTLFALERGNLIFFALLFLALYLNASTPIRKSLYLALLINIKPYFLILLIQYLKNNGSNWKILLYAGLFSALIFLGLGFLAGMDFAEFFKAYIAFSRPGNISSEGIFSLPHSLAALAKGQPFFDRRLIFGYSSTFTFWFSVLKVTNLLTVLILIGVSLFHRLTSKELLIVAIIVLTNFSVSTSGYILLLYIPLLAYLIDDPEYRLMVVCLAVIFAMSMDWLPVVRVSYSDDMVSYLRGNRTLHNPKLFFGLGSIVRPILNYLIMINMIFLIYKKYRNNGHAINI